MLSFNSPMDWDNGFTYEAYDDNICFGNPNMQMDFWELQTDTHNCAVAAETSIINQFGIELDQETANYRSATNGWYKEGIGTSPDDIGKMMELHGIPTHTVYNASVADLAAELRAGNGVIVGVNSDELNRQGPFAEMRHAMNKALGIDNAVDTPANHAVVVTGIDPADPSNPMVILNDPGVLNGQGISYPLDKFMDAWENGNFRYTATDIPIPNNQNVDLNQINFYSYMTNIDDDTMTRHALWNSIDRSAQDQTALLKSYFRELENIQDL